MASEVVARPVKDWSPLIGKCYLHPVLDYLLIGAAISIPFVIWVLMDPSITPSGMSSSILVFIIFNGAHFASSTVRLYTKPGEVPSRGLISYGLPIVAIAVTTLCLIWPKILGTHLWALYMTWSPYHYAAQAYGLALLYCYRSGVILDKTEKRIFWGLCMIPFIRAMLMDQEGGLGWFTNVLATPDLIPYRQEIVAVLSVLIFTLPIVAFFMLKDKGKQLPLISWMLLAMNGLWWVTLSYSVAWFWAAIFHSIQYLVIVVIFHANDQVARPENENPAQFHVIWFYTVSLFLGAFLFLVWPRMYTVVGFSGDHAMQMTIATINLHHFIVDGYIWRSAKKKKAPPQAVI